MKFDRKMLRLYAVTAGEKTGPDELRAALDGGVTCVQLREKNLSFEKFLEKTLLFKKICESYGVALIVNDRIDVAERGGADGVHLGQSDGDVGWARRRLGVGAVIGLSAHTVDEARNACEAGADYLGVGAIFPTATKADAESVSLETLREITAAVSIPVVAIGGIHRENCSRLRRTAIAGIAVVSDLFLRSDILEAAETLNRLTQNDYFA